MAMDAPTVHEKVIAMLDEMGEEELQDILTYIQAMKSNRLPDDYNPDNDPAIGFLSGSTDLARRAEEILEDEITSRSGWTQKKD